MTQLKITILKQYLAIASFVVLVRVAFRLIFGGFSFESLLLASVEGGKIAVWVLMFGLLNLVVDFRKLIKRSPRLLHPFTTALNISLSVTPELAHSYQRVRNAAKLRAQRRGIHFVRSVIVPVVSNAIDQSVTLGESMDARGYGQSIKPARGGISLKDLNFAYSDGKQALRNVEISIPAGQFTLITGNTGSGKTTLLRVIQAKVPGVGFVSQFPRQSFLAGNVFDELAFSLIQSGVSKSGIESRVASLANQFGLDLKANPLELSAGWQQRVAIAAALSSGSKVLMLDEPFSALDENGSELLLETLQKLKDDGVTLIVAEHRIQQLLKLADVGIQITNGQVTQGIQTLTALQAKKSASVTALIGENGSGKTSYLQKLAAKTGVLVPQPASDLLFLDTVSAELIQSDQDAGRAPGTTKNILKRFNQEINELQNPRDLSEGQKLILALSVQLTKQSKLLMLDEPTLGLDTPSRQTLVDIISELGKSDVEVLVATHDREFAEAIATKTVEVSSVGQ